MYAYLFMWRKMLEYKKISNTFSERTKVTMFWLEHRNLVNLLTTRSSIFFCSDSWIPHANVWLVGFSIGCSIGNPSSVTDVCGTLHFDVIPKALKCPRAVYDNVQEIRAIKYAKSSHPLVLRSPMRLTVSLCIMNTYLWMDMYREWKSSTKIPNDLTANKK